MNLEDKLISLLAQDDRRPLVRALCACARPLLLRAEQVDPFNATIVITAEKWAAGSCDEREVRQVYDRARSTRGAAFTSVCLQVIVGPAEKREQAVRMFAQQVPTTAWMASEAGQQWAKKVGPTVPVGSDPDAMAQIAVVRDDLCGLVERVTSSERKVIKREPHIDYVNREVGVKIVYVGPGLAGKATNLQYAVNWTKPAQRGQIKTTPNRNGFSNTIGDFRVPPPSGFGLHVYLYALPGAAFYREAQIDILECASGVVFVADSRAERAEDNLRALRELEPNLAANEIDIETIPMVLQYNKRDDPSALKVEEMQAMLNPSGKWQHFEAVATQGIGVLETLRAVLKPVFSWAEPVRRRFGA